jgi:hypothetical protein
MNPERRSEDHDASRVLFFTASLHFARCVLRIPFLSLTRRGWVRTLAMKRLT